MKLKTITEPLLGMYHVTIEVMTKQDLATLLAHCGILSAPPEKPERKKYGWSDEARARLKERRLKETAQCAACRMIERFCKCAHFTPITKPIQDQGITHAPKMKPIIDDTPPKDLKKRHPTIDEIDRL